MRFLADAGVSPKTVEFKPSVIVFRLADERADSVNRRLATVLAERLAELEAGALILVEDSSYRVRKLPIGRT
jgi:predicted nuclease of predicted toxin-antitoxin system